MRLDPDLHMRTLGVKNESVLSVPFNGMTLNVDYIDPLLLSTMPTPMGLGPNQHRLSFDWDRFTGPNGFIDELRQQEPANIELKALANFVVTVGPNPVGCDADLCPPHPPANSPPPPPPTNPCKPGVQCRP